MKKLILLTLLLQGCIGTGVRPIEYNGETIYEAKCNGAVRTIADCYEQASKTCQDLGKKSVAISQDGSSQLATMNNQLMTATYRNLMFKCM